jgi:CRISPR-associated endonuclease Cas1
MAAASTVLPEVQFRKSPVPRHGVLALSGYGVKISMQSGHLELNEHVGGQLRTIRLSRVNHRLKRLVCLSEDGFITFAALRWLSDVGASFVMLDRLGKVQVVTGPNAASESRLRRAQALALSNSVGLQIVRELIGAKLNGQETLVRERFKNAAVADEIAKIRSELSRVDSMDRVRWIESRAAALYWGAWHELPIVFPRKDSTRVPRHWLRFGSRRSPLTGGPRLSVNPANTLLNFTFAVAESECRLALVACGLDPGLGFLHTDTANRDSLALDIIEPIRPAVEAWILDWLTREPLRRADFFETANGNCRMNSAICSKLCETAPTWSKLAAPWAEFVARSLWGGRSSRKIPGQEFKTPLTQENRREAKRRSTQNTRMPKPEHRCSGCGKNIRPQYSQCIRCAAPIYDKNFEIGRQVAHTAEARAKQSLTSKLQRNRIKQWNPAELPQWLTREYYVAKIIPALKQVSKAQIRATLTISEPHAIYIGRGLRIPHPRHWLALCRLAGIPDDERAPRNT